MRHGLQQLIELEVAAVLGADRHERSEELLGYRNGAGVLATLRTAALNLLRLSGFYSIREGLHAVMHDITALLAMAMRQPRERPN